MTITDHINSKERLQNLLQEKCLITGREFKLSTGSTSNFYFDCKRATLDGECLNLIVDLLLEKMDLLPETPEAIGGLSLGADPIISALITKAFQKGHKTILGSIVRKDAKGHGTKNKIENELKKGTSIVVVDDVITRGRSIGDACVALSEFGYNIVGLMAVIDRKAGGKENLESKFKVPIITLFDKFDFPKILELENSKENNNTTPA